MYRVDITCLLSPPSPPYLPHSSLPIYLPQSGEACARGPEALPGGERWSDQGRACDLRGGTWQPLAGVQSRGSHWWVGPVTMTNVAVRYSTGGWFVCVRVYNSACDTETVTFIGSHLDVVPANPETWERNPFKLQVEVATLSSVNLSSSSSFPT